MNTDLDNWPLLKVYHPSGTEFRHVRDLVFLQGYVNYTWLEWSDGWRVLVTRTMKVILASLPATHFIRVHRQFAVNRLFVDQTRLFANSTKIYLTTGRKCLPLSRRRRAIRIHHQLRGAVATTPIQPLEQFERNLIPMGNDL